MHNVVLDFVVYLGDPDEGAETVDSQSLLADLATHRSRIDASGPSGPHGALVVEVDGKSALPPKPDPVLPLVTHLVKAVPYVLDGEPESFLYSESEHGVNMMGGADEVLVSFFKGDPFEPDELLLPETPMPLGEFGAQVVAMGERLRDIINGVAPSLLEADASLLEFLEVASEAVKQYQLEVERGVRVT